MSPKLLGFGVLGISTVTVLLLVFGITLPDWYFIKAASPTFTGTMGLWEICYEVSLSKAVCMALSQNKGYIHATRAVELIAVMLMSGVVVLFFRHLFLKTSDYFMQLSAGLAFASGYFATMLYTCTSIINSDRNRSIATEGCFLGQETFKSPPITVYPFKNLCSALKDQWLFCISGLVIFQTQTSESPGKVNGIEKLFLYGSGVAHSLGASFILCLCAAVLSIALGSLLLILKYVFRYKISIYKQRQTENTI